MRQPLAIGSVAERSADVFGWWSGVHLLDAAAPGMLLALGRRLGPARLVAGSGSFEAGADEGAEARMSLRTHGGEGMRALLAAVEAVRPGLEFSGARLCLLPHAAQVLSDVPSCLLFLRSAAAEGVQLVLDPVALLTPAMLDRAEEHLERILEALAGHPGVAALRLTSARLGPDGAGLEPIGLHRTAEAVVDARLLIGLFARYAGPGSDWIILEDGLAEQQELLRMYGPGAG